MGQMNKSWHARNPMPDRATFDARAAWHKRHATQCACRKMPAAIAAELARRAKSARRKAGTR
jgi:hypothetical protein